MLVPSYRGGEYLAEALHSLERQTYKDFRVIVMDSSGEGRATDPVKSSALDIDLHTIEYRDDAGNEAARRLLYECWDGRGYACWLHDDDAFHPDRILDAASWLDANPEVDIAFCGMMPFRAYDLEAVRRGDMLPGVAYADPTRYGWTLESYQRPTAFPSKMFRASMLDLEYPSDYECGANDLLQHFRAWAYGLNFGVVPRPLYYWRVHHDGGEMANCSTPVGVASANGFDRKKELLAAEVTREAAEMREAHAAITRLSARHGQRAFMERPGVYRVDGRLVDADGVPLPEPRRARRRGAAQAG